MIIKQLKAIKEIAEQNVYKSPAYFIDLIDEIDLQLLELESEKLSLVEYLEMEYVDCDGFDLREVG